MTKLIYDQLIEYPVFYYLKRNRLDLDWPYSLVYIQVDVIIKATTLCDIVTFGKSKEIYMERTVNRDLSLDPYQQVIQMLDRETFIMLVKQAKTSCKRSASHLGPSSVASPRAREYRKKKFPIVEFKRIEVHEELVWRRQDEEINNNAQAEAVPA